jgi:predicted ATPase
LAADALLAVAGGRRLVLVVDDVHLADDLSAALVRQLVRGAVAFVLVVVRSGEPAPEPVTALWRNRIVERVDLQQLLRPDVEQLLAEHLGGPVDGLSLERLWQASAGNALPLRELVTAGVDAGALRRVEGVWRWQGAAPPSCAGDL